MKSTASERSLILNKTDSNTVILAEKLYLYEGKTLVEIAATIGKSEKTIRNWKDRYNWDSKKTDYLASIRNLPQQLYEDYTAVMQSIREDLAEKRTIAPARYNLADKHFEQIPKAAEVEKAAKGSEKVTVSPEMIMQAVRKSIGLEE